MGRGGPADMGGMPRGARKPKSKTKAPPVNHVFSVSLEELNRGVVKKMRITRKVVDGRTGEVSTQTLDKEINVQPGWKDGTKITFEGLGDDLQPGAVAPADIVFTLKTKPHDRFE